MTRQGSGLVMGFIAYLQLGITSSYNAAQITITNTSLPSLLKPPLVVAWFGLLTRAITQALNGSRTTFPNSRLETILLWPWPLRQSPGPPSSYSDYFGLPASELDFQPLAIEPFPSNGSLYWLLNFGCQHTCHNIILSRVGEIILVDGVWIGEWIYCQLIRTTRHHKQLQPYRWSTHFTNHCSTR
jgi:hypothetical protein